MKPTLTDGIGLLGKEIEWCGKNADKEQAEYQKGFIKGLEQSIFLLKALDRSGEPNIAGVPDAVTIGWDVGLLPDSVAYTLHTRLGFQEIDGERVFALSSLYSCPNCQADLLGVWLEKPWFEVTDGGQTVGTADWPSENWVVGVQACPECGHKWEMQG